MLVFKKYILFKLTKVRFYFSLVISLSLLILTFLKIILAVSLMKIKERHLICYFKVSS